MSFPSGRRDLDSFPIPRCFAAVCAMGLALSLDASIALADPGSVELRNGGRVRGEIVAVIPLDRVVVLVEGAGSMTIAWSDVDTVIDGERTYQASGDVSTRSSSRATAPSVASTTTAPSATAPSVASTTTAPSATAPSVASTTTAPSATAPSATAPSATAPFVVARAGVPASFAPLSPAETRESLGLYSSLPSRGGAVTLTVFGSLVLAQGIILTALAGSFSSPCFECGGSSSFGRAFLIPGTLSMGLGALMLGLGIRKLRVRSRAVESLRARGFFVVDLGGSRTLGLGANVTADRIVPQLEVRF